MSTAPNAARPFVRPSFLPLQPSASPQSSAYQSYSSTSSLASPSSASSAPLPSPSSCTHPHTQAFFGSLNQQPPPQQAQHQHQNQHQNQHQQQSQAAVQPQANYDYRPNREGAGRTAAETNHYLNDYALLAEAAKRAQMAVVMRDIEGMEL